MYVRLRYRKNPPGPCHRSDTWLQFLTLLLLHLLLLFFLLFLLLLRLSIAGFRTLSFALWVCQLWIVTLNLLVIRYELVPSAVLPDQLTPVDTDIVAQFCSRRRRRRRRCETELSSYRYIQTKPSSGRYVRIEPPRVTKPPNQTDRSDRAATCSFERRNSHAVFDRLERRRDPRKRQHNKVAQRPGYDHFKSVPLLKTITRGFIDSALLGRQSWMPSWSSLASGMATLASYLPSISAPSPLGVLQSPAFADLGSYLMGTMPAFGDVYASIPSWEDWQG